MRLQYLLLAGIIAVGLFCGGCGKNTGSSQTTLQGPPTVAEVNGTPITRNDFMKGLEEGVGLSESFTAGRRVLDTMIGIQLVEKELKAQNITISDAEVKKALEEAKQSIASSGGGTYEAFLKQAGISETDLTQQLKFNLALRKLVVTKSEMEEYFRAHPSAFNIVKYYFMAFRTKAEADAVYKETTQGKKDFSAVAREKNMLKPGTKALPLNTISEEQAQQQLPPAVINVLFSLKPGEVSNPIAITNQPQAAPGQPAGPPQEMWILLKVESHNAGKTFADSENEVALILFQQKSSSREVFNYINSLKAKAKVSILDPKYKSLQEEYQRLASEPSMKLPATPPGMPQPAPVPGAPPR
jgi:hypothetical protein